MAKPWGHSDGIPYAALSKRAISVGSWKITQLHAKICVSFERSGTCVGRYPIGRCQFSHSRSGARSPVSDLNWRPIKGGRVTGQPPQRPKSQINVSVGTQKPVFSMKPSLFVNGSPSITPIRLYRVYHLRRPQSGSLTSLVWTPDGTQLAGAGGNGAVVFAQVVERSLEWENFEVQYLPCWQIHSVESAPKSVRLYRIRFGTYATYVVALDVFQVSHSSR